MADFGDLFSQYIDKRINSATEPFTNPGEYMSNRIGASIGNTGTEAQVSGGSVQPVAPVAGQPKIVPEGQVINLANSAGLTIPAQPVAPAEAPPAIPGAGQFNAGTSNFIQPGAMNVGNPPNAFNANTSNTINPRMVPPGYTTNLANSAGPAVPMEQPPLGLDKNEQVVPEQQLQPVAPAANIQPRPAPAAAIIPPEQQPRPAPAAAPDTTNAAPGIGLRMPSGYTQQHYDALNSGDPKQLAGLLYNPATPPAIQQAASEHLFDKFDYQNKLDKATKTVDSYLEKGDVNGVTREINKKGDEGSYIKAILFARLGLTDLAQQEQEKISPTKTTMPVAIGSDHYSATYNKNGELIGAKDENGRQVDDTTLAKIAANGFASKGATTGQSFMKDKDGNIWSHTITPGTNRVIWTNQNTGATSTTAPAGLTPFGQVNPITKANIAILQSKIKKMESDNVEASRTGSTPPHSTAEIDALKEALVGGGGSYETSTTPGGNVVPTNAANVPISGAAGGKRLASTINNPAGIGWNGKDWYSYQTPQDGVRDLENYANKYLSSQGPMSGIKPTPENVAGMFGFGKDGLPGGSKEAQGAQYGAIIRQQLQKDGISLNSDGTIPNTKESRASMSRAILAHETTPQEQDKFLPYITGEGGEVKRGTPINVVTPNTPKEEPVVTAGKWTTPEANTIAKRNPTAESIAEYRTKPPTATGRSGAGAAALMNDVRRINPDYNEQKYEVAKKERDDYTKVNPASSGGQLQAINRAVPHLDQYKRAVDALNNGDMPLFNKIANQYQINVGNDKVAGAKAIQALVSTEVQKAVAGGLGGVEERKDLAGQMSTSLNPKQLANVIDQYQGLITAQGVGLKQKWTANGLPGKEWDEKLVPAARDAMMKHEKRDQNQRSKW